MYVERIGRSAGPSRTEEPGFLPPRPCLPWAVETKARQREETPQAGEVVVLSEQSSPRASARPQPGGGRAGSWGRSHAAAPLCPTPPSISGPPASFSPRRLSRFLSWKFGCYRYWWRHFSPVFTPAHVVLALCPTVCSTLKTLFSDVCGGGRLKFRDWW